MIDLSDRAKLEELHKTAAKAGGKNVDPGVLVASAGEAIRIGAWDNAASLVDAALIIDPERGAAWSLRGQIEEKAGRLDNARKAFETALAIDDKDLHTALALAALYNKMNDSERARALINWLLLEDEVPAELRARAAQIKENLAPRKGATP